MLNVHLLALGFWTNQISLCALQSALQSVPWYLLLIMVTAGQDKKNKQICFSLHLWSKVTLRCWKKGQIKSNFSFAHLFGPGRFIAGVDSIFVMIELLLLCRSGVLLLLLLLLLLLERDKVSPLLVKLSLQSVCLSLFLHLFTFILLKTERL